MPFSSICLLMPKMKGRNGCQLLISDPSFLFVSFSFVIYFFDDFFFLGNRMISNLHHQFRLSSENDEGPF